MAKSQRKTDNTMAKSKRKTDNTMAKGKERQTIQWPKIKGQNDKQSTKHYTKN